MAWSKQLDLTFNLFIARFLIKTPPVIRTSKSPALELPVMTSKCDVRPTWALWTASPLTRNAPESLISHSYGFSAISHQTDSFWKIYLAAECCLWIRQWGRVRVQLAWKSIHEFRASLVLVCTRMTVHLQKRPSRQLLTHPTCSNRLKLPAVSSIPKSNYKPLNFCGTSTTLFVRPTSWTSDRSISFPWSDEDCRKEEELSSAVAWQIMGQMDKERPSTWMSIL